MLLYCTSVITIALIVVFVFIVSAKDENKNREFLESYGWEVAEEEIEIEEITIPKQFDLIYNNYNVLQKQAGLDLSDYKGKKAIRYTYLILNYPTDIDEEIRANVITVKGVPVAGDIMTTSLNGFMHSLNYPENQ